MLLPPDLRDWVSPHHCEGRRFRLTNVHGHIVKDLLA